MTHISLPENIEEIPEGCFSYSGLEEIVIPRKVKKIVGGDNYYAGAFQDCESLQSIVFEQDSELMEIGNKEFYKCKNLRNICLPDKLREIGWSAFENTSFTQVQVPANMQIIEP